VLKAPEDHLETAGLATVEEEPTEETETAEITEIIEITETTRLEVLLNQEAPPTFPEKEDPVVFASTNVKEISPTEPHLPIPFFVANLPFALEDDGLSKLFKDLKVTKAHVVKNRNQRSKGFGFVEFANEADQKAALAAAEKMVVDSRELIVKVALTAPEPRESANAGPSPSASAVVAAAPAAASTDNSAAPSAPAASPATPAAAKEAQPAKADDKSS